MTSPTPRKAAAPAPAAKTPALNLAMLAAHAVAVKELPKSPRKAGGTEALADLVKQSYTDRKVFELPGVAVPAGGSVVKVTATLTAAVRRAAALAGLGVSVRASLTDRGVVVTFQGKRKGGK